MQRRARFWYYWFLVLLALDSPIICLGYLIPLPGIHIHLFAIDVVQQQRRHAKRASANSLDALSCSGSLTAYEY